MPGAYAVTETVTNTHDPLAVLRSALKHTAPYRTADALAYVTGNEKVNVDELAGFFKPGSRAAKAITATKDTQGVQNGVISGKGWIKRKLRRHFARAFSAELANRASEGVFA